MDYIKQLLGKISFKKADFPKSSIKVAKLSKS